MRGTPMRNGRLAACLMLVVMAAAVPPSAVAAQTSLDFRADTFPLQNVAAADLPYHA